MLFGRSPARQAQLDRMIAAAREHPAPRLSDHKLASTGSVSVPAPPVEPVDEPPTEIPHQLLGVASHQAGDGSITVTQSADGMWHATRSDSDIVWHGLTSGEALHRAVTGTHASARTMRDRLREHGVTVIEGSDDDRVINRYWVRATDPDDDQGF